MENSKKLTQQELEILVKRFKEATDAEDKDIIQEVMGIVWGSIVKYATSYLNATFPTYFLKDGEDMLLDAYISFHENFYKYDPKKGAIITWARIHLHHGAQNYIDKNYAKTTAHYAVNIKKIKNEITRANKNGMKLSLQELVENTGIPISTVSRCLEIINNSNEMHIQANDYTEGNLVGYYDTPEEVAIKKEETDAIHRCIDSLTAEEKKVITYKYGFTGKGSANNADIAKATGIRKENVRRIATNAERTLRLNIQREQLFSNRKIKAEIDAISEEIIFIPKYKEEILIQTLQSLDDIDF